MAGVSTVAVGHLGDRDVIVSGSEDATVRVWDAADGANVATMRVAGPIRGIALDPHRGVIYAVGSASSPYRFDISGL
jgi:WD40 repeat protein